MFLGLDGRRDGGGADKISFQLPRGRSCSSKEHRDLREIRDERSL